MTYRTRIKMCGITREQDLLAAANAGADALGLVFYDPSPRNVSIEQAVRLKNQLPPFIKCVALFMNPDAALVANVITEVAPDTLQFHGKESPDFCEQFGRPYIKAVPMGDSLGDIELGKALIRQYEADYQHAEALLLDSHSTHTAGGSGKLFSWESACIPSEKPLIVAGGLQVENVQAAIRATKAFAVDVSSGIEATKGIKDSAKMRAFAEQVNTLNGIIE